MITTQAEIIAYIDYKLLMIATLVFKRSPRGEASELVMVGE